MSVSYVTPICRPDALQAYWLYHLYRMEIIACLN